MSRRSLSRRRFGATLAALGGAGLAGCMGDEEEGENENDGEPDFDLDEPGDLTIELENENGERVSDGVSVTVESVEEDFRTNIESVDIADGEITTTGLLYEGEYNVIVESTEGEFDTVEESVTIEEDRDETVTAVLEGATGDD
ncbi:hypothetical protein [Halobiforma nitratireducens]|uniref:Cytochrome c oxidase, subunit II n=1 Tax=Halobiforma nitratireducens JCM 10879 TaxID=1227454 RepID=M0LRW0_9EURY|nr:hypothetical protein [Halobiforma nitratireducens]EMA36317.1 cytochrome c oxidase, subunit II [Halobiforma nitratireducens JCM 10879]